MRKTSPGALVLLGGPVPRVKSIAKGLGGIGPCCFGVYSIPLFFALIKLDKATCGRIGCLDGLANALNDSALDRFGIGCAVNG